MLIHKAQKEGTGPLPPPPPPKKNKLDFVLNFGFISQFFLKISPPSNIIFLYSARFDNA